MLRAICQTVQQSLMLSPDCHFCISHDSTKSTADFLWIKIKRKCQTTFFSIPFLEASASQLILQIFWNKSLLIPMESADDKENYFKRKGNGSLHKHCIKSVIPLYHSVYWRETLFQPECSVLNGSAPHKCLNWEKNFKKCCKFLTREESSSPAKRLIWSGEVIEERVVRGVRGDGSVSQAL